MNKQASHTRPEITAIATGAELKRWYWLKEELVNHARELGIRSAGSKFTILDRIAHFLDTGEKVYPGDKATKARSKFDWHREALFLDTIITDNYRNTQKVRRFFREIADPNFKFNIEFMAWMKSNIGKSLGDAVEEYWAMRAREGRPGFQTRIEKHNQFNQYTRDFLEDNPDMGMKEVRKYWALKRSLPTETGYHIYEPSDLELE